MDLIAVLTAAEGVSDAAVSHFRELCGGGEPTRLSATAVEMPIPHGVSVAAPEGVDVNFVPAEGRRKKLLIADMDSTIIGVECIDELADFAGKKADVAAITELAMRGELDFEQALDTRVATLRGVTRAQIEQCRAERVRLNPGAETLVRTMNAQGAMTALVSGGFTVFTEPVAAQAGFQMNKANVLLFDGDALNGAVARPICSAETKLETLGALIAERNWQAVDVIAVGDGANDGPMIQRAGLGVAYRAKPVLREMADAVLNHSDLTALLALQGIPEREWAILPAA